MPQRQRLHGSVAIGACNADALLEQLAIIGFAVDCRQPARPVQGFSAVYGKPIARSRKRMPQPRPTFTARPVQVPESTQRCREAQLRLCIRTCATPLQGSAEVAMLDRHAAQPRDLVLPNEVG